MSARPLPARLRTGLHAYRQLGPVQGTAAAARHIARAGRGRARAIRIERRPVRVTPGEVRVVLGGRTPAAAILAAGQTLPSVLRWQQELSELTAPGRADLLRRADDVLAHRFDLLGSGPVELGEEIDWHLDFKAGRSWPLRHISQVPVSFPDPSDIKVPWELSRFQHLPLLAAAHRLSADRRYLNEIGLELSSWIAANPVEVGVNWACTMDVAIRAVNWVAALAMCAEAAADAPWLEEAVANLLLHGRFIRGHLEFGPARGNHYLSDVVGLLIVAAVFAPSDEGQTWIRWSIRELGREIRHQVREDGCDHETSTSYHRLVAELFIVAADAADVLAPGSLDPLVRTRIDQMLDFVTDYTRPDGLAPQIGDADDGRLLPLGDYARADQRSHLHLFAQAQRSYRPATVSAAYAKGGFYILRAGDLYAAVRCGDVGIYGRGCHAHNDLLGFELCIGRTALVVDPGSYLYTADPVARNRFRSTGVHSTLQIDGAEQNELREDRLFAMVDRAQARVLEWQTEEDTTTFTGTHHGFQNLAAPAEHVRTLCLRGATGELALTDQVRSQAPHSLSWCFQLAPSRVELGPGGARAEFGGTTLTFEWDGLEGKIGSGWISPAYGRRFQAPTLQLRSSSAAGEHRTLILLRAETHP
ncbi:MAG: alginate lyase family protein [Solirubrobacteraceae bacterium]